MNFLELVKTRQSVRKYLPKEVEPEKIARCIEAARLAPSACNSQPWTFLVADRVAGFNEVDAHARALFYYLSVEPKLEPAEDPRFIPGRGAVITIKGRRVGIMGEVHPQCLENWGIEMPCAVVELSLDDVRRG